MREASHLRLTKLWKTTRKAWPRTGHELREGHPVTMITALAKRTNADLIVMGTLARTGLQRGLIGSVAERVVRHAPCPVLWCLELTAAPLKDIFAPVANAEP